MFAQYVCFFLILMYNKISMSLISLSSIYFLANVHNFLSPYLHQCIALTNLKKDHHVPSICRSYIQHWRPVCDGIALQHVHILGHPLAELVAQVSHVQRLCSRCSSPGFKSDLVPPILFPVFAEAVLLIKPLKGKKYLQKQ